MRLEWTSKIKGLRQSSFWPATSFTYDSIFNIQSRQVLKISENLSNWSRTGTDSWCFGLFIYFNNFLCVENNQKFMLKDDAEMNSEIFIEIWFDLVKTNLLSNLRGPWWRWIHHRLSQRLTSSLFRECFFWNLCVESNFQVELNFGNSADLTHF